MRCKQRHSFVLKERGDRGRKRSCIIGIKGQPGRIGQHQMVAPDMQIDRVEAPAGLYCGVCHRRARRNRCARRQTEGLLQPVLMAGVRQVRGGVIARPAERRLSRECGKAGGTRCPSESIRPEPGWIDQARCKQQRGRAVGGSDRIQGKASAGRGKARSKKRCQEVRAGLQGRAMVPQATRSGKAIGQRQRSRVERAFARSGRAMRRIWHTSTP